MESNRSVLICISIVAYFVEGLGIAAGLLRFLAVHSE